MSKKETNDEPLLASDFVVEPRVGVFRYDVHFKEIFSVSSDLAFSVNWTKSKKLNKEIKIDPKMGEVLQQKKTESHECICDFFEDFVVEGPPGYVIEIKNEGFVVCVGDWINEISNLDEIKEMIIDSFQLSKDNTKFMKDKSLNDMYP